MSRFFTELIEFNPLCQQGARKLLNHGEVLNTAIEKARQLAEQPPAAVRLTKYLLKRTNETLISETIKVETMHFRERTESPEAAEAFEAFAQRRKPDFSSFK